MTQTTLARRSAVRLTGAVVGAIAVVATLVAVLLPAAALVAVLTGALLTALVMLWQASLYRKARVQAHSAAARAAIEPVAQRLVYNADGSARQALVVPIAQNDDYELVLTVDGYALADETGRIIYKLKR